MRRYAVAFAPRAIEQLDDLYADIAGKSGANDADRYIDGIVTRCRSLSAFPERGTKRDDIRPNLRTFGHKRTSTIAFSVDHARLAVTIVGVFYGGQDFEMSIIEEG